MTFCVKVLSEDAPTARSSSAVVWRGCTRTLRPPFAEVVPFLAVEEHITSTFLSVKAGHVGLFPNSMLARN
jgi:hypothetical protein